MLPSKPWCDLGYFRKGFLRPDLGSWCFSWWPPFRLMKTSENIPHHEQVEDTFFFGCDVILIRFDTVPYTYIYFDLECFLHILLHLHKCWIRMRLMYQWLYLFGVWGRTTKSTSPTLPKTNSSHLNIGRVCPKRKLLVVSIFPIHFQEIC